MNIRLYRQVISRLSYLNGRLVPPRAPRWHCTFNGQLIQDIHFYALFEYSYIRPSDLQSYLNSCLVPTGIKIVSYLNGWLNHQYSRSLITCSPLIISKWPPQLTQHLPIPRHPRHIGLCGHNFVRIGPSNQRFLCIWHCNLYLYLWKLALHIIV